MREGELGETKDKIEKGGMADETEASTAGFILKNTLYPVSYTHLDVYKRQEWGNPAEKTSVIHTPIHNVWKGTR